MRKVPFSTLSGAEIHFHVSPDVTDAISRKVDELHGNNPERTDENAKRLFWHLLFEAGLFSISDTTRGNMLTVLEPDQVPSREQVENVIRFMLGGEAMTWIHHLYLVTKFKDMAHGTPGPYLEWTPGLLMDMLHDKVGIFAEEETVS